MRDHGGNLDAARARWGGDDGGGKHGGGTDWIDLSTGINRVPYPLPAIPAEAWAALPTQTAFDSFIAAARAAYGTRGALLPVAGAQAAIQRVPRLDKPGRARVLGPTYNEHAAALRAAGWAVDQVATLAQLSGADLAVVVNPNNPDGQTFAPNALRALRVGRLIVDESFADPTPALSVAAHASDRMLVLRSFGKFYGLAGLRLGCVIGGAQTIAALAAMAGPWAVSGPALAVGTVALQDRAWATATTTRLTAEAQRLDAAAARAGWNVVGGTALFRLYDTPDATAAQDRLARAAIWSRIFPYSTRWLRLGLPGAPAEWARVEAAL